jgi:hypothetical protein
MNRPTTLPFTRVPAFLCAGIVSVFAASTLQSHAASVIFSQDFETDTSGWLDNDDLAGYGNVSRVSSGTNGVTSQGGSFHGEVTNLTTGPYTDFGGYSDTWPGSFDYSVAVNDQAGANRRDYVFHVTNDSDTGTLLVNADNGTGFTPSTGLELQGDTMTLAQAGWYTFRQTFSDNGSGVLSVQMEVLNSSNSTVFSKSLSSPTDIIATEIGGNRYGWFTALGSNAPLAIDNASLTLVPEPSAAFLMLAGVATAGLRRRRR